MQNCAFGSVCMSVSVHLVCVHEQLYIVCVRVYVDVKECVCECISPTGVNNRNCKSQQKHNNKSVA